MTLVTSLAGEKYVLRTEVLYAAPPKTGGA